MSGPNPELEEFRTRCSVLSNRQRRAASHEIKTKMGHESVACPGILFGGGLQQIQLRTEDRENGDLGAVAP